jgi:hypothetical protein
LAYEITAKWYSRDEYHSGPISAVLLPLSEDVSEDVTLADSPAQLVLVVLLSVDDFDAFDVGFGGGIDGGG